MIDWVSEYAKAWGACSRWMRAKTEEGYPHMDVSARILDGGMNGNEGVMRQHFGEVRLGRSLAVARVLITPPLLDFDARMCFEVHYTDIRPQKCKIKQVCHLLGRDINANEYFRRLDHSHYHLAARITPIDEKPLNVVYRPKKQMLSA